MTRGSGAGLFLFAVAAGLLGLGFCVGVLSAASYRPRLLVGFDEQPSVSVATVPVQATCYKLAPGFWMCGIPNTPVPDEVVRALNSRTSYFYAPLPK